MIVSNGQVQPRKLSQDWKNAIVFYFVLKLHDFIVPVILETNASASGIGVVLSQCNHTIAYFFRKWTPHMQKQSAYVRELFALIEVVGKFRYYLTEHKSAIKTDQEALKHLGKLAIKTLE